MANTADITASCRKPFVVNIGTSGYTIYPNELVDFIIGSNLPYAAKLLVLIVFRYSAGYQKPEFKISTKNMVQLLPIREQNIPALVRGLIKLNILKGGPYRSDKRGILEYNLAINLRYKTWDISFPSDRRTLIYELHKQAIEKENRTENQNI